MRVRGENRWRKNKREEIKREREEEKRERKKERKGEREGVGELLPLFYRRFDGQSLSGRDLKFVYSTRATLQEVRNRHWWTTHIRGRNCEENDM